MKNVKLLFPAFFLFFFSHTASGQRLYDPNFNFWVTHLGDHRLSQHWGIHTEAHLRVADAGQNMQQILIRPALNYQLNDNVMFTAGYSYYRTYPYGDHPIKAVTPEHHSYEQVTFNFSSGRFKIQNRYRIEQRFIGVLGTDNKVAEYTYLSRARIRLGVTVPLNKPKMEKGAVFVSAYDEVFINFSDTLRGAWVHQNRISLLAGYQILPSMNIQAGYLLQDLNRYLKNSSGGFDPLMEENSIAHLIWTWNLDFRQKEESH